MHVKSPQNYTCITADGLLALVVVVITPPPVHNNLEVLEHCKLCMLSLRPVDGQRNYVGNTGSFKLCEFVNIAQI